MALLKVCTVCGIKQVKTNYRRCVSCRRKSQETKIQNVGESYFNDKKTIAQIAREQRLTPEKTHRLLDIYQSENKEKIENIESIYLPCRLKKAEIKICSMQGCYHKRICPAFETTRKRHPDYRIYPVPQASGRF